MSEPHSRCQLAGRVAVVTGAGRGIGRAIARHLHDCGASVGLLDSDAEAVRNAAASMTAAAVADTTATTTAAAETEPGQKPTDDTVANIVADVAVESAVQHAVAAVVARFGHLDILVNNAGISAPGNAPLEALAVAHWQQVLATNLTGAMLMAKHALPHLRARRGAIVNIASTRALQSEAHTEAYAASKGGLVALTHAMAVSLGPAVRVNCISPGWIDTSQWHPGGPAPGPDLSPRDHAQHPAGRVGQPEDIAALCAFLVAEQASFITGQNFVVDGGMTRKMIYED